MTNSMNLHLELTQRFRGKVLLDPCAALRAELSARFSRRTPNVGDDTVSLDQPASSEAFWSLYDATGIRPEYLIPVLSFESGLNPSVRNHAGAPYYGIGQNSEAAISSAGAASVDEYLTWPASRQIHCVVKPYFQGEVRTFGPLKSGIKVYQAEFYPVSLRTSPQLDDVIVKSPQAAYTANKVFDQGNKGYITPRDLGHAISSQLNKANVQAAIAEAYNVRPNMAPPLDSIYGEDFSSPGSPSPAGSLIASTVLVLALGGAASLYHREIAAGVRKIVEAGQSVKV